MKQGLIANCVFAFSCPRRWDWLEPTADPSIRHCDQCVQDVHLCHNQADFTRHANAGHCVAVVVAAPYVPRKMVLGMPAARTSGKQAQRPEEHERLTVQPRRTWKD